MTKEFANELASRILLWRSHIVSVLTASNAHEPRAKPDFSWYGGEVHQPAIEEIARLNKERAQAPGEQQSFDATRDYNQQQIDRGYRSGGIVERPAQAPEVPRSSELRMIHDFPTLAAFFEKHALGSMERPSCLVCGRVPEQWPPAIRHLELASIIVCHGCVAAARGTTEPVSPQAPIAKVIIRNGKAVMLDQYAPGLPDGDHDLYCEPPDLGLASSATPAAVDVLAERWRQKNVEGWTPAHDDLHKDGSLAAAAATYAFIASEEAIYRHTTRSNPVVSRHMVDHLWPTSWDRDWLKPKNQRRDLVRAGALILAEIERLDRMEAKQSHPERSEKQGK